jgi:hypothetical protein
MNRHIKIGKKCKRQKRNSDRGKHFKKASKQILELKKSGSQIQKEFFKIFDT